MAPWSWTSQEAQVFVNTFYSAYQTCQATKDYSSFWPPFFEVWGAKFPECLVVFHDIPLDQDLDIEQTNVISDAYKLWTEKLVNKLRNDWGMLKASRKAKNNGEKAGRDMMAHILTARQTKAVQSLSVYEAYSKLYYTSRIKPVVDKEVRKLKQAKFDLQPSDGVREGEDEHGKEIGGDGASHDKREVKRVAVTKWIMREMYEKETEEVKDEVAGYIKQIAEKKTQVLETTDREIDHQNFHVGRTEMGNLFSDAYPNFNGGIMKPWLEFINRVFPTAAAKALVEGFRGANEAMAVVSDESVPDDVSSHDKATSDVLTSALVPPLDESEELEHWAENYLTTFGPIPGHAHHSLSLLPLSLSLPPPTLPFLEVNVEDSYNFSWLPPPLPPIGTPLLQGDFVFPHTSSPPDQHPLPISSTADTSINSVINPLPRNYTSPTVAMMAPHATVCNVLQALLKQQSNLLAHTAQPDDPPQNLVPTISLQALDDLLQTATPAISQAQTLPSLQSSPEVAGPSSQQSPTAPSLSPPGSEEVPSVVPPIDKPAEVSECKHQEDEESARPMAESLVTSHPKCVCMESRCNEITNSIGQENTIQKKYAAQKNQKKKTVG
ncbi:hypothetical protein F4604DRAFT_1686064 [Suillus subluteus]|nr:hypothetical protein F4604DRAFT_1686064 [Suillus subluteus]